MNTTGLVRVTVAAPARRIDLALPERAPLAELLPGLLRHAGEDLADLGAPHGGWVLRRPDGTVLDPARTLAAQRISDGEVLHLTHGFTDWPELEYDDDLADAIASGSARTGDSWGPRHTRTTGLAIGALSAILAIGAVARSGPPWAGPGWWSIGVASVLLAGRCCWLGRVGTRRRGRWRPGGGISGAASSTSSPAGISGAARRPDRRTTTVPTASSLSRFPFLPVIVVRGVDGGDRHGRNVPVGEGLRPGRATRHGRPAVGPPVDRVPRSVGQSDSRWVWR